MTDRIRAIDWLRGLSVILMLECHALYLLAPEYDHGPFRDWLNLLNGLVAPTFILAAGLSLALVATRSSSDPAKLRQRGRKSLRRILGVLGVGILMRFMSWNLLRNPIAWLWIDILSCIAFSLLIAWAFLFLLRVPARAAPWVFLLLGLLVFGVSPIVREGSFGPVFTHFLNNTKMQWTWPLVPWSGFAFLGAWLGGLAGQQHGRVKIAVGFTVIWLASEFLATHNSWLTPLYAPNSAYIQINMAERLLQIGRCGLILLAVEWLGTAVPWLTRHPLTRLLEFFGRCSLSAFFFRSCLLFGCLGIPFLSIFGHHCSWPQYWMLLGVLEVGTGVLCWTAAYLLAAWSFSPPIPAVEPALVAS